MKTLTILFLLLATNLTFAISQDFSDCNAGSADNAFGIYSDSTPSTIDSSAIGQ